ncbi:MAG: NAD-dependent epimerase/dehydratase family protein [Blastocatellales bacterium]
MNESAKKRSAFVTGATGCIGSALTLKLAENGWQVVALVRDHRRADFLKGLSNLRLVEGDLADRDLITNAMRNCQVVFHLAAKVHATPDLPANDFFTNNVDGTCNVVAAAIENQVDRLVFFSTVAVYPESDAWQDESSLTAPTSAYGASKLRAEAIALASDKLKATVLRLPVVYGLRDRGNVARLIEAVKRGRYLIVGDGQNLKSMVAVENVVEAAILAAIDDRAIGQTFIVTDQRPYSQAEIAATIAELLDREKPRSFPRWPLLMIGCAADAISKLFDLHLPVSSDRVRKLSNKTMFSGAKIESELGFKPQVNLREGLARVIENEIDI